MEWLALQTLDPTQSLFMQFGAVRDLRGSEPAVRTESGTYKDILKETQFKTNKNCDWGWGHEFSKNKLAW